MNWFLFFRGRAAAKHTAELEALRKELAATSITRLDTLAAERIEAATQGLHDRSAEIVRNSKTRQAQVSCGFPNSGKKGTGVTDCSL